MEDYIAERAVDTPKAFQTRDKASATVIKEECVAPSSDKNMSL